MASPSIAMSPQPRIRIAICGGGIGGLSLAVVLNKYCSDVQIDLYEAAPQFTEIGAGISVWKRTWFIMQLLGLDASLGKMTVKPPVDALSQGFVFRKSDQEEQGFNFHPMIVPYGSITLHRADMLKVLSDNLLSSQNLRTHFSKRLVSYEQAEQKPLASGGVTLHFLDGSSAQADLLVGADGIKSATRATMYTRFAELAAKEDTAKSTKLRSYVNASWSGTYAYRALVESEKLLRVAQGHQAASSSMMYCGKDKHVVSYPISQGRLVNLVAFVTVPGGDGKDLDGPAVVDVSKQEMLECYKGWEPEVQQLLDCVDKPSRWAISHIRDLPSYVDGRVALLGDSAHPMTTHLGAGGGQAIEDAHILGRLLAHPLVTNSNLPSVLGVYNTVRRPFGNGIVERSRSAGFLYEFNGLPETIEETKLRFGEKEELEKLGSEIYKKWTIQWTAMPDMQWKEALQMVRTVVYGSDTATPIRSLL